MLEAFSCDGPWAREEATTRARALTRTDDVFIILWPNCLMVISVMETIVIYSRVTQNSVESFIGTVEERDKSFV
jgi:hypothetical protein